MQSNDRMLKHFHHDFPMPPQATLKPYSNTTAFPKKNKNKLIKFTYYSLNDTVLKVLFLDQDRVVDQGMYPFTNPSGSVKSIKDLGQIKRLHTTQTLYVGHFIDKQEAILVLKKLSEAKIQKQGKSIETNNDDFETMPAGNGQRFEQFLKVLKVNPKSAEMSIRVIIQENEKGSKVIDYEFFQRESHLSKSKLDKKE